MSTLERAIEIARKAHEGQSDKGGAPYITHPLRVMERVGPEDASRRSGRYHSDYCTVKEPPVSKSRATCVLK